MSPLPILLAEDSDQEATKYNEIIQSCGYTVVRVKNGLEAWSVVHSQPSRFTCIVSDYGMGGKENDGLVFLEKMVLLERKIPFLLHSGGDKGYTTTGKWVPLAEWTINFANENDFPAIFKEKEWSGWHIMRFLGSVTIRGVRYFEL